MIALLTIWAVGVPVMLTWILRTPERREAAGSALACVLLSLIWPVLLLSFLVAYGSDHPTDRSEDDGE